MRPPQSLLRFLALLPLVAALLPGCVLPAQQGGPAALLRGERTRSIQAHGSLGTGGVAYGERFGLGHGLEFGFRPAAGYPYVGGEIDLKARLIRVDDLHGAVDFSAGAFRTFGSGTYFRLTPSLLLGYEQVYLGYRLPLGSRPLTGRETDQEWILMQGPYLGFRLGSELRLAGELGVDIDRADHGDLGKGLANPYGGLALIWFFGKGEAGPERED